MNRDRVGKLSENQKIVLRYVARGLQAKEIALELGVTHFTVKERLRAIRHILDVQSSREAARLLAEFERGNTRGVYTPGVVDPNAPPPAPSDPSEIEDAEQEHDIARDGVAVHEGQAPYRIEPVDAGSDFPLRIPFWGGTRDDLKLWQIIIFCAISIALALLGAAILIKVIVEITSPE